MVRKTKVRKLSRKKQHKISHIAQGFPQEEILQDKVSELTISDKIGQANSESQYRCECPANLEKITQSDSAQNPQEAKPESEQRTGQPGFEFMIKQLSDKIGLKFPVLSKVPNTLKMKYESGIRKLGTYKEDKRKMSLIEESGDLIYQTLKLVAVEKGFITKKNQCLLLNEINQYKTKPSFEEVCRQAQYLAARMITKEARFIFGSVWPDRAFAKYDYEFLSNFYANLLINYYTRAIRMESKDPGDKLKGARSEFQDASEIRNKRLPEETLELMQYLNAYTIHEISKKPMEESERTKMNLPKRVLDIIQFLYAYDIFDETVNMLEKDFLNAIKLNISISTGLYQRMRNVLESSGKEATKAEIGLVQFLGKLHVDQMSMMIKYKSKQNEKANAISELKSEALTDKITEAMKYIHSYEHKGYDISDFQPELIEELKLNNQLSTGLYQHTVNLMQSKPENIVDNARGMIKFLEKLLHQRVRKDLRISTVFYADLAKLRGRQELTYTKPKLADEVDRQKQTDEYKPPEGGLREIFKPIEYVLFADLLYKNLLD